MAATKVAPSLLSAVLAFRDEKSVALSRSTIATNYEQPIAWLKKCPYGDLAEGRKVITWVLQQEPRPSAVRVAQFLKSFYRWAASEDVALIETNPITSYRLPKPGQTAEVTVIREAELPRVLTALERRNKALPQWDLYARFMLQTGMRTGEVRAVHEDDIHGNKLLVHRNYLLRFGLKESTKTNRTRWVPLNEVALGVIDRLQPVDGWLFPWNRQSFQNYFISHMAQLHEAGEISARYRPYDLRHTAISRWLEAGVPVTQASSWAGNSPKVIWESYAATTSHYDMPVL